MVVRSDSLSEESLRSILDHEPVGVSLYAVPSGGGDFVHAYANPAFRALRPGVRMIGRTLSDVWPEYSALLEPVLREVARTGRSWIGREVPLAEENAEGGLRTRFFTLEVSRIEIEGEPYVLESAVDTSPEVEARAAGETRLSSVLASIPEGLIVVDPEGEALQWNPAALAMHGWDHQGDELSFLSRAAELYDVFTLDGRCLPLHEWPVPRLLRGEEFHDLELVLRRKHGDWKRIFSYYGAHFPAGDGTRLLALLSIRDVTETIGRQREREELLGRIDQERAQLEAVLERQQRDAEVLEFRSVLLASVSDSVIAYWADEPDLGSLLYVNRAAYETRGYTLEEILALKADDLIAPERRSRFGHWLDDLTEHGETTFESVHRRKDGSTFPVEVRARLIEHAGRRVVVNASRDISGRKRAEEQVHRELETTRLLLEAAEALGQGVELSAVAQAFADVAARSTGRRRATVFLREPDTDMLRLAAESGPHVAPAGTLFDPAQMSGQLRTLLAEGGISVIDYGSGAARSQAAEWAVMHRALVVTFGSPVTGFVSVDDPGEAAEFRSFEIDLLAGIASQASVAIENARLLESEREARAAWAALAGIGSILATATDLRSVMPEVLHRVCEAVGANGATVSNRVEGGWRTQFRYGAAENLREFFTDEESPGRAEIARTREPYVMPDALSSPEAAELAKDLGFASYVVYPLLFRDQVIGAVSLLFPDANHRFSDAAREFIRRCVFTISSAQDSARLVDDLRESRDLSEALNRIDAAVNSTLDFDEIMDRVIAETARAVDADSAVIYLREDEGWTARYVFGLPAELVGRPFTAEEIRYSEMSPDTGDTIVVNDARADPRVAGKLVEAYGITSVMGVALRVGESILGDFSLHYHSPEKHFNDAQADFADKVAASLTLAVRNAEAYSSERDIADTLQQALLTLPVHIEGVSIGHLYRSATKAAEVGGDFYDVFQLGHNRVGILLGDVSGKGINAAATTALVRDTIRAYAYESDSPAEIVGKTNRIVTRETPESSFVTLFFGILECETCTMRYCNAGHPPAMLRTPRGTRALVAGSPLIGAFRDMDYTEDEQHIDRDDVLVLYTDGAIEARCEQDLYGEERLLQAIAAAPLEAEKMPEAIFEDILGFTGGMLSDDLALLTVSVGEGCGQA